MLIAIIEEIQMDLLSAYALEATVSSAGRAVNTSGTSSVYCFGK
jgi:hypothetical protein